MKKIKGWTAKVTGLGSQTQVCGQAGIWTQVFWIQMPWTFLGWHANDTIIYPSPLPNRNTGLDEISKEKPFFLYSLRKEFVTEEKVNMPRPLQTKGDFFTSLCINEISSQPVRQRDLQHEAEDMQLEQRPSSNCNIIHIYKRDSSNLSVEQLKKIRMALISSTVKKKKKGKKRETYGIKKHIIENNFFRIYFLRR